MPMSGDAEHWLLELTGVQAGYEGLPVVRDVHLHVGPGEVVAVIGHNGAGKSTLIKSVFGILPLQAGVIRLRGVRVDKLKPWQRCRAGMAYVPQGTALFSSLTVRENLRMAFAVGGGKKLRQVAAEQSVESFPGMQGLVDRRGRELSGGERQIASVLRAFAMRPEVVLLDEPSLGLAPSATRVILELIQRAADDAGCGVVLVEQKVRDALSIATRVCVLRQGSVTYSGRAQELATDAQRLREVFL